MKARFEKHTFIGSENTSAIKYKHLHNLPHWHIEYELVFVLEGSAEIMINNVFYEINQGDFAFISSEDIHYIKATAESILGIIKTDAPYIKKIIRNNYLPSPIISASTDALQVFESVFSELKNEKNYYEIVAELIITKFIADLFRNNPVSVISKNSRNITTKYKDLLEMLANNYTHITFENAAAYVNLNKSYFSKYFYRFSGMTFTQYLNILKVSAAIEKLYEKRMTMTEISISCGFGTIRNFNRVFKSLTGYSPKKLPEDYVFIYNSKDSPEDSFDPTLNCTKIIE